MKKMLRLTLSLIEIDDKFYMKISIKIKLKNMKIFVDK